MKRETLPLYEICRNNRPFPSSKKFHFQNEANCETFVVEMSFDYDANKTHFHNKGFALSLVLKVKLFGTRKWPIQTISYGSEQHFPVVLFIKLYKVVLTVESVDEILKTLEVLPFKLKLLSRTFLWHCLLRSARWY